MPKIIFFRSGAVEESSLTLNDDGTLTYWRANDGWAMTKNGSQESETMMTPEEAKKQWPQHSDKIDEALRDVQA